MTIEAAHDGAAMRAFDPTTNAEVTWEGPEYKTLQPIVFGYAMFEALHAACELRLFAALSERPGLTLDELAPELALSTHSTRLLLLACASIELVVRNNG